MSMIYFVITCLMSVLAWACSQMKWMYRLELFYAVLFLTGVFLVLIFIQQEDNVNKKYNIFTPRILLYYAIVATILIVLRKYNIREYETVKYAFIKLATIINAVTASVMIMFYKARAIYYNW